MTYYVTTGEIIEAIRRAPLNYGELNDGTYNLVPTWVGRERVWMAEPVSEYSGYEVAWTSVQGGTNLNLLVPDMRRIGVWTDDGVIYLDHTIHVQAPAGVALDIARLYSQEAVWDWAGQQTVSTSDPATAL